MTRVFNAELGAGTCVSTPNRVKKDSAIIHLDSGEHIIVEYDNFTKNWSVVK